MLLKVTSALSLAGVLSWWDSSICGSMKRPLGQRARPELGEKTKDQESEEELQSSETAAESLQQKACSVRSGFYTSLHVVTEWSWVGQNDGKTRVVWRQVAEVIFFLLTWRNFEVFKPLTCLFCKTVASDQLHIHSAASCLSISFSKSCCYLFTQDSIFSLQ